VLLLYHIIVSFGNIKSIEIEKFRTNELIKIKIIEKNNYLCYYNKDNATTKQQKIIILEVLYL